jgi:6-pyruvoyltetrahydropterin/6-carboxytetrahydropterin synthase
VRIRKRFRFESSHVLPHHTGKCARLHGHSYRLEVTVRGA